MYNIQETEHKILNFWEKNKIFEKLKKKNKGKKRFSFLDGPITANNPMGIHHAWGRTYKDVYQRFKAMQGYDQRYQNGFDCQGLWIEREEEKDLGFKNKADIEKFGILKFVEKCKARVERFAKLITEDSIRLGQWMDWDNSYYTNTDNNILHNWFLLKEYYKKGWLYKGKDAIPWCPRCGTASSKHDIITEGYKETKHNALFMRFPVKGEKDEYFLIFTTTPWTVPANVAIAVNSKLKYAKVEYEGKKYWVVKNQVENLFKGYKILEEKTGKELAGTKYEMPYSELPEQRKANAPYIVVEWELASEKEGTGIVHIAPGCGAEDYELGKKENFPSLSPLDEAGIYSENWGEFSGKLYSEVNKLVLEDMTNRNFVFKIEPYVHRYPHCWRCGTELVFRLVDEWYIKADNIRKKLIEANKKVKWFPEYGKKRQEEWFNAMGDWLISRKRYYGLPLPIWECDCGFFEVIGSLKELKEKAIKGMEQLKELHRPWIDNIILKCPKCKKEMKRVEDVGDAWLDAGIVPFSTLGAGYLNDKENWEKWFPADFICENMPGQYRGWFNALFWASVTLTEKCPFKSVLGYETLKDEKGREMHKSLGNAIWAKEALEKLGADPLRLNFCLQNPTNELWFGWNSTKEANKALNVFWNISRLVLESKSFEKVKTENIEDKWILSKLNTTISKVTEELEHLHPHTASKELVNFWLEDFSRVYIHFVRDRISEKDSKALNIINYVYLEILKLLAPICPFITEAIYQEIKKQFKLKEESIHLYEWPKADEKAIDKKLEEEFVFALEIIEKGLASRSTASIGVRWPLASCTIKTEKKLSKEIQEIVARQINVKKIIFKAQKGKLEVELETKLTPELEAEGYAHEIARAVQDSRKKAGLKKEQKIELALACSLQLQEALKKHEAFIRERVNASTFALEIEKLKKKYIHEFDLKIKGQKIKIAFDVCQS